MLVPLFDLKFLTELAAIIVGTSNRRHQSMSRSNRSTLPFVPTQAGTQEPLAPTIRSVAMDPAFAGTDGSFHWPNLSGIRLSDFVLIRQMTHRPQQWPPSCRLDPVFREFLDGPACRRHITDADHCSAIGIHVGLKFVMIHAPPKAISPANTICGSIAMSAEMRPTIAPSTDWTAFNRSFATL